MWDFVCTALEHWKGGTPRGSNVVRPRSECNDGYLNDIRGDDVGVGGNAQRSLAAALREAVELDEGNARLSSERSNGRGGMQLLAHYAAALAEASNKDRQDWELHVVGHSAGSIFAAHALAPLLGLVVALKTLQFMAPAICVDAFKNIFSQPMSDGRCPVPTQHVLSDVGSATIRWARMASRCCTWSAMHSRDGRIPPLGGMQLFIAQDPELSALFGQQVNGLPSFVIAGIDGGPGATSRGDTHGGFDNDPDTLNSVLFRILGGVPSGHSPPVPSSTDRRPAPLTPTAADPGALTLSETDRHGLAANEALAAAEAADRALARADPRVIEQVIAQDGPFGLPRAVHRAEHLDQIEGAIGS